MKKRILFVDDDPDMVALYEHRFNKEGFEYAIETTGEQAIARAADFDLIILDHHLPDLLGGEVARRLKEDERTRNTPVVLMSGMEGEHAHVEHFLLKPFAWETLADLINKL